ncbi:MAG: hypothetical protein K9L17_13080 [Clostridiales bacterium]|nr:hypothetical protein [Clostridiales bacterium]
MGWCYDVLQGMHGQDWLINELESIPKFNPEKERIKFRPDIFTRIIEKGTMFPNGRIIYDLKLGIPWTATGNDMRAWHLKMKKGKK